METGTAAAIDQIDAALAGRGGVLVVGEFLAITSKPWKNDPSRVDWYVHVLQGTQTLQVRYRDEAAALDALGGVPPLARDRVMLAVYVRAPAKDFVAYDGRSQTR